MIQIGKRSLILTKLLLIILYLLLIIPIGLLCRILSIETLDLGWRIGKKTYWNARKNGSAVERYTNQF
jgi:hypothetical protein